MKKFKLSQPEKGIEIVGSSGSGMSVVFLVFQRVKLLKWGFTMSLQKMK